MSNLEEHEVAMETIAHEINYICQMCGEGVMIYENATEELSGGLVVMKHSCKKCGKMMLLSRTYPYIKFIRTAGKEDNHE